MGYSLEQLVWKSSAISVLRLFVISIPLAYWFAIKLEHGTIGIWWGIAISIVVSAVFASAWFKMGTWKKGKHLKEVPITD